MADATPAPIPTVKIDGPITQQPVSKEGPSYKIQTGAVEWNSELFGCLEGGFAANDYLCLKTTFCPCFTYGKQQERLRDPSLTSYERVNHDCVTWAGAQQLCGLNWIINFIKRGEIREKYNIRGSQLSDFAESFRCGCCVLIQQEKEIIKRQG